MLLVAISAACTSASAASFSTRFALFVPVFVLLCAATIAGGAFAAGHCGYCGKQRARSQHSTIA